MWDIKVGMQVVAVKYICPPIVSSRHVPIRLGRVLTVRSIYSDPFILALPDGSPAVGLAFEEIKNPAVESGKWAGVERMYAIAWFRPVRKTDISALQQLLRTKQEDILEDEQV